MKQRKEVRAQVVPGRAQIDLGVPEVEVTEEEDFVHLRVGEQHEVFSAYGATIESLRETALEMIEREAQIEHGY